MRTISRYLSVTIFLFVLYNLLKTQSTTKTGNMKETVKDFVKVVPSSNSMKSRSAISTVVISNGTNVVTS
ncbi:hypothetical protein HDV05_005011 [Chytridiales sp. JEL 0842]|nr:hypothetical protein HDV05_005011 [Chytridiales sp. JEL 0842]